jgi:hypothetical protein
MLTLTEIFAIIIIHFIGDFILQTEKQAKDKSKNWNDLLGHTYTYSVCWFVIGIFIQAFSGGKYFPYWSVPLFTLITFITHTITDYFTSRLNNKLAPKEEVIMLKWNNNQEEEPFVRFPKDRNYHNFFESVGFDQVLHYIQLFLTYYYLKQL